MLPRNILVNAVRDVCLHCKKPIHWSERERKWFHLRGLMTFCTGLEKDKTEATPTKKWESSR